MSSDITSGAPKKKRTGPSKAAPVPVVVWTRALDDALDVAETEWLTPMQFAEDDRFATRVENEHGARLVRRHSSGLRAAAAANVCGLYQSRRLVRVQVPCRGGHKRTTTAYAYALWRINKWLGLDDSRRTPPPAPSPLPPLEQSVRFTPPPPQEEIPAPGPLPRPRTAPSVQFMPPPASTDLEEYDTDYERTTCDSF